LFQRSAQEAGLGGGSLKSIQDITKPKLFPEYEWHSSGRQLNQAETAPTRTEQQKAASTVYLIRKSRDIQHRFQNSPQCVRPAQEADVNRYGKRQRPMEPDVSLLSHIGKAADSRILPAELLKQDFALDGTDGHSKRQLTLEDMASLELKQRRAAAEDAAEAEDGDLNDQNQEEDEDEEVDDYITNYYESEEESDGGAGGEATF
jgi:hypothetical protein